MNYSDALLIYPTEASAVASLDASGIALKLDDKANPLRTSKDRPVFDLSGDWHGCATLDTHIVYRWADIDTDANGDPVRIAPQELYQPDAFMLGLSAPTARQDLIDAIWALVGCVIIKPRKANELSHFRQRVLVSGGEMPITLAHIQGCVGVTRPWAGGMLDMPTIVLAPDAVVEQ